MRTRSNLGRWQLALVLTCAGPAALAFATGSTGCGSEPESVFEPPVSEAGPTTDGGVAEEDVRFREGPYLDFPAAPVLDDSGGSIPSNVAELFANASAATEGGPCLLEPEVGTIYPRNWLRPRFRWVKAGAQNLFEVRVHADNQANDLVVYTAGDRFTMPKAMWEGLRFNSAGVPMTVTVRAATWDGSALTGVSAGSSGPIAIAPVDAPGTIVYWTGGSRGPGGESVYEPALKGFRIGDESVQEVLRPAQVGQVGAASPQCFGCHSSTPDGLYAAISVRNVPSGDDATTRITFRSVDGKATPAPISASAQNLLARPVQTYPVFSKAHYRNGDRVALSMLRVTTGFDIVWTDLEATNETQGTAWDVLARTGDPNYAALASFSNDGKTVVYVSTTQANSDGTILPNGSIYTVPYNDRAGGAAVPVPGANDPTKKQFYPSFSPDDKFIVYNRSTSGTSSYEDPDAELYVIPAVGGTATRLAANDPPACWPSPSPGIHNAWPKWSPGVRSHEGKTYYFVVFSSSRSFPKPAPRFSARLYITTLVVEGDKVTTHPSLYLWNQPDQDNHSPAWDEFKLPPK